MSQDRVEGAGKKLEGAVKDGLGKLVGDAKLQADGKADKASGSVQNTAGKVEDEPRSFDHDRVEGAGKKMAGSVKEGVGKLVGDAKLQADGKAEKAEGTVQNAVGGLKDAARDAFRKD